MKVFIDNSRRSFRCEPASQGRWLDKLILIDQHSTPIELFNHRFFSTPASFYFYEMLQLSKVMRYHVTLKTDELLDP